MALPDERVFAPNDRRGFLRQVAAVAIGATVASTLGAVAVGGASAAGAQNGIISTGSNSESNLVTNGSFEQFGSLRQPTGWVIVP